jgi:hypothetical protein
MATNTQINTNEFNLKFVTLRVIRGKMKTFHFIKRVSRYLSWTLVAFYFYTPKHTDTC